jgi:UDP-glucose 4-epimerase
MQAHGVRKLVFSSSATVYGAEPPVPMTEELPTSATNPYGWTKVMQEQILRDVAASDPSWRMALLRYFNPVGAHPSGTLGEDPQGLPNNLVPFIAQVAVGRLQRLRVYGDDYPTPDGTAQRDYIHVLDLAAGHVAALERLATSDLPVDVWNLGTGTPTTVLEMLAAFSTAVGRDLPYEIAPRRAGDIATSYADPTKARTELGWAARLPGRLSRLSPAVPREPPSRLPGTVGVAD